MKKNIFSIILAAAVSSTLMACDHIANHNEHAKQGNTHSDSMHQGMMHSDNMADHQNAFHDANMKMMDDMHSIELTGDASYDFVKGMIPHHQGAIDMAKVQLASGSDAELKKLSEQIIAAQQSEIAWMQNWLIEYGPAKPGQQANIIKRQYDMVNAIMMRDMHTPATGNVDVDFVRGMIPHHEAAVDMARVVLAYSEDAALRQLSQQVIDDQSSEIEWMKNWLAKQ